MELIQRAFNLLYPNKPFDYATSLKYSAHFKPYNASVRLDKTNNKMFFRLSTAWKEIDDEIKIGLVQNLLAKLFRTKTRTENMELYYAFIRNLHIAAPKTHAEPTLAESFARINKKYFSNEIEQPNLVWGNRSFTKLGSYEYQTDTIIISSLFKSAPKELLDYIMYHEALHKKHKFYIKNNRSYHHTHKFKADEKRFENSAQIEKNLKKFLKGKKRVSFFSFLFQ